MTSDSEQFADPEPAISREQAQAWLEAELLRGLDSGPATEMTQADWDDLRETVQQRANLRHSG